jgi:predicted phage terminase large subunit-like protein
MNIPTEMIDDFRNHLWACFKYLGLGEPTPAQYAMADALQNGPVDMQLQAGRGFGKSVITACLASWFLLKDHNTTIMVVSATGNKATEFISMTRKILDLVPYCEHLRPGDHTTDNAFAFDVECRTKIGQDKSCFARGIGSQITGSHAEYVIADDVEIEGNCETANAREKLLNKISEFEQIRNVGGRVLFLGTPQIKDSVYNQLAEGYPVTKFPSLMPDKNSISETENVNEWIMQLGIEEGEPTQPERFPIDVLLERMAKIGPKLFALHYKLDTTLADFEKFPLRLADLIVIDVPNDMCPEKLVWANSKPLKGVPSFGLSGDLVYEPMWMSERFVPYTQTVVTVDPSGRGDDETAVCVASLCNGYVYIHELIGYPGGYERPILQKITKLAMEYSAKMIRVESNFGDAMYAQLLIPVVKSMCDGIGVTDFKVTGRKETRILSALEPVMAQHRLVFDRRAICQEETQKQLTRLFDKRGALAHDDRVDCLASAVSFWEDSLALDVENIIRKRQSKERNKVVDDWQNDDRRMGLFSERLCDIMVNRKPIQPVSKWTNNRFWNK